MPASPDPAGPPDGALRPPAVPGYRLERLLGRGGSGEVWRAVPRAGGRPVAVKVLLAGDAERQAREAALLGALDHPHLVRLHEVVHQPRRGGPARVALVLDLLEGGSLADLLARRGRLRPGEVVTALAPVAAALACAHGQGVVHGDLSPGNVVFTAEGRPVLTDLGVARVLGEEAAGAVTPAYVDPAVARGAAPGPASDVFGVAAAAFHALTGVAPWNAATPADTLAVAATAELPDLAELTPGAPPALLEVVARGLSPDPHDRGSAAAFALDLRHACRPEPVLLSPADGAAADAGAGRVPRTELTHEVPGRHRRPPPREVRPAPRRLLRLPRPGGPLLRRAAVALGVAGLVVGAVWLGTVWTRSGPGGADGPAAAMAAATAGSPGTSSVSAPSPPPAPSTARTPSPEPTPSSEPTSSPPPAAGPGTADADWPTVLTGLYARRAEALSSASAAGLGDVYTPDSALLAADRAYVEALAASGEVLRGFRPVVEEVTATGLPDAGGRVVLRLVDSWPSYDVVAVDDPGGVPRRTEAGRERTPVSMVLVRTPGGWRIESAGRLT
ncbi:serine/threonine protein kinase [Geodermatophilus tzadiensis]|uniref:non-specific serine/threonine protein kinase n=1 Tax=Geodermatophilus tzadiensis TaxID=1137988 RepID=A0A2T0TXN2_9ACTN|nr:serine/threonine-protein kinase [Geodermatophilus tzadiensis]PRY50445.1 serine/threonine protein kinase [Geodermatophilus tzadiensis]